MDSERLLSTWRRLRGTAPGRWLFSYLVGRTAPYSGSIRGSVLELEPGHCRIRLRDRPRLRNHLRSIHAIALANVAELASGLAMLTSLPTDARGIVTRIDVQYEKKARGTLVATSASHAPERVEENVEHVVEAEVHDETGERVAVAHVHWRLGPRPEVAA